MNLALNMKHPVVSGLVPAMAALIIFWLCLGWLWPTWGMAGVQSVHHYIPPETYALGFEPELTLTNGAGVGGNLKYTRGISNLNNLQAIIGTGGGPRRFRVGGNMSFDIFPDVEGQPGIGFAPSLMYYRVVTQVKAPPKQIPTASSLAPNASDTVDGPSRGQLEFTLMPYIHKTFVSQTSEIEPYVSVPFGMAFSNGSYQSISTVVIGAMFKGSETLRFNMELGVAINRTESYVSGGLTYYPR